MTLPIRTERLWIRRFSHEDVDDIVAFAAHPSVAREITNIPHDDREKLIGYIDTQNGYALFEAGKCIDLAVEQQDSGTVIGLLSVVSDADRQAEIGWGFGIEHRGQGLATEAARELVTYLFGSCGYHRVYAGTIITNTRSWKLMERLGMRKEAHFVQSHVPAEPGGKWIDTVRYAVLAEEWET